MAYYQELLTLCEVAYNDPSAVYCFHSQSKHGHGYPVLNNLQNCTQCQGEFLKAGFRLKLNKCRLDTKSEAPHRPNTTGHVQFPVRSSHLQSHGGQLGPPAPPPTGAGASYPFPAFSPYRRTTTMPMPHLLPSAPSVPSNERLMWVEALNCWIPESRKQIPYITFVNSKPIELPPERPTTFTKHVYDFVDVRARPCDRYLAHFAAARAAHMQNVSKYLLQHEKRMRVVFRRQLQSSTTRGHGDDGESVDSSRKSAILAGQPSPNEKLGSAKDSGIDVELLSPHKSPYGNRVTFAESDILDESTTKSACHSRSGRASSTEVGGDITDRPPNPDSDWLSADDGVGGGTSDVEADPLDRVVSASSTKLSSHESDYMASSAISRQTSSGYRHRFSISERGDATPGKDEGVFSASTKQSRPSRGGSAGSLLSEVTPIDTPVQRRSSVPVLPDVPSGLTLKTQAKKKTPLEGEDDSDLSDQPLDGDSNGDKPGPSSHVHPAEKALEITQLLAPVTTVPPLSRPKGNRRKMIMLALPQPLAVKTPEDATVSDDVKLVKEDPPSKDAVENLEKKPPLEAKKKSIVKRKEKEKVRVIPGLVKSKRKKGKKKSQDPNKDAADGAGGIELSDVATSSDDSCYDEDRLFQSTTPSLPSVQIHEDPTLHLGVSSQSDQSISGITPTPSSHRRSIQKKVRVRRDAEEKPETPPALRKPPPPKAKKKASDWIFDDSDDGDDEDGNLPAIVQQTPSPVLSEHAPLDVPAVTPPPPTPPPVVDDSSMLTVAPPDSPSPESPTSDSQAARRTPSPDLSGSVLSETESQLNERLKRWGEKKIDKSIHDDMLRLERAEERRRKAQMAFNKTKGKKVRAKSDVQRERSASFDDYGFLNKYCIFNKANREMFRKAFDAVDEDKKGFLNHEELMVAMKGVNRGLTDAEQQYLYRVLEITGYKVEHGADFKLFSVIAALSLRIASLDSWMRNLIGRIDFKMLDMKMFKCKTLWECNVDPETNNIPINQLCVELRAGGISQADENEVRHKLRHLQALDLLDFLTYVPLFIMIHESVVEHPLGTGRVW